MTSLKTAINVTVQPFVVQNYVYVTTDDAKVVSKTEVKMTIDIGCLSAETLSDLCDNFRKGIFGKAGQIDPKQRVDLSALKELQSS